MKGSGGRYLGQEKGKVNNVGKLDLVDLLLGISDPADCSNDHL